MKGIKGPTRAQLQARIERLGARIKRLQAQLKPDPLRQPGQHWYQLVSYFDAKGIQKLPTKGPGRAYLMGMLHDRPVVEISQDYEHAAELDAWVTEALGVGPMIVTDDVRFLRLAFVSPEREAELDAEELVKREKTDGQEDAGQMPALRAAEGEPEDQEVPAVPEDGDPSPDPPGPVHEPDAPRE